MRKANLHFLIRCFSVTCTCIVILVIFGIRSSHGIETLAQNISTVNQARIFTAGDTFSVTFSAPAGDEGGVLFWCDHHGNPTTPPTKLNDRSSITVESPDTQAGYYGLVYQSPQHLYEYGFVIQPARPDRVEAEFSDQFGMVHADYQDPYLPSWVKTLTWKTVPANAWSEEIAKRRAQGKLELPLILGREWSTDSNKPISLRQLLALEKRLFEYLSADLTVTHWELGLEENLKEFYSGSHYWSNLHQKVLIARKVANRVNPDIKFIYQIGGKSSEAVRKFAQSDAAKVFDILAVHPYGWPEFLNPDNWYADYLTSVDSILAQHDLENMPLWITEIGIPHHSERYGGSFTEPVDEPVRGSGWGETATNLVKMHAISLHRGIEKVFWYNYVDREAFIDDPENFFGLFTNDKSPRPAYAAYTNFIRLMRGKQIVNSIKNLAGVQIYTFKGNNEFVSVIWSDTNRSLPITELAIGAISSTDNFSAVNIVGTTITLDDGSLNISEEPIFLKQRTR